MIRNESMETLRFEVGLELGCDFADIFSVKEHDFTLGDPENARPLPPPCRPDWDERGLGLLRRRRRHDAGALLADRASRRLERLVDASSSRAASAGSSWSRCSSARAPPSGRNGRPSFGEELAHVRDSLAAWHLRVPQVNASWDALGHAFSRSVSDLAALRMRADGDIGMLPGRRDAVVHDRVRPRHADHVPADADLRAGAGAHGAARAREPPGRRRRPLPRRRARQDRPRGAHRQGRGQLVRALLRHGRRDAALPRAARRGVALDGRRRARERAEGAGARGARAGSTSGATATATASSSSSAARSTGSRCSRGRTRGTRSASTTARSRRARSPPARSRATSTPPSVGSPRSRARPGATGASPTGSSARRPSSAARFDEAFWVEERGGFYALALDGEKRRVDSLTSNIGQLLCHRDRAARARRARSSTS